MLGMGVVCWTDNALANAVVDDSHDWSSLWMDDIATPGSYWWNPPRPRDNDGNAVDFETVIQAYEDAEAAAAVGNDGKFIHPIHVISTRQKLLDNDALSYAELAKLLADIDPLGNKMGNVIRSPQKSQVRPSTQCAFVFFRQEKM